MNKAWWSLAPVLLFAAACGTAHTVRPVGAGKTAWLVDMGGPYIGQLSYPVPMADVGVEHGLTDEIDVGGSVHVLPLFVDPPILGLTGRVAWFPLEQVGPRPALGTGASFSFFGNGQGAYAHFDVPVTASWSFADDQWLAYGGTHLTTFLTGFEVVDGSRFAVSPYVGAEVRVGSSRRIGLGTEITWYQVGHDSSEAAVEWLPVARHGAVGAQLRLRWYGGEVKP